MFSLNLFPNTAFKVTYMYCTVQAFVLSATFLIYSVYAVLDQLMFNVSVHAAITSS